MIDYNQLLICPKCNVEFKRWGRRLVCKPCVNSYVNEYNKKTAADKREREAEMRSLTYSQRRVKWITITRGLKKMKKRDEWQEFFKTKLDEITADRILMAWITREGLGKAVDYEHNRWSDTDD